MGTVPKICKAAFFARFLLSGVSMAYSLVNFVTMSVASVTSSAFLYGKSPNSARMYGIGAKRYGKETRAAAIFGKPMTGSPRALLIRVKAPSEEIVTIVQPFASASSMQLSVSSVLPE